MLVPVFSFIILVSKSTPNIPPFFYQYAQNTVTLKLCGYHVIKSPHIIGNLPR